MAKPVLRTEQRQDTYTTATVQVFPRVLLTITPWTSDEPVSCQAGFRLFYV